MEGHRQIMRRSELMVGRQYHISTREIRGPPTPNGLYVYLGYDEEKNEYTFNDQNGKKASFHYMDVEGMLLPDNITRRNPTPLHDDVVFQNHSNRILIDEAPSGGAAGAASIPLMSPHQSGYFSSGVSAARARAAAGAAGAASIPLMSPYQASSAAAGGGAGGAASIPLMSPYQVPRAGAGAGVHAGTKRYPKIMHRSELVINKKYIIYNPSLNPPLLPDGPYRYVRYDENNRAYTFKKQNGEIVFFDYIDVEGLRLPDGSLRSNPTSLPDDVEFYIYSNIIIDEAPSDDAAGGAGAGGAASMLLMSPYQASSAAAGGGAGGAAYRTGFSPIFTTVRGRNGMEWFMPGGRRKTSKTTRKRKTKMRYSPKNKKIRK